MTEDAKVKRSEYNRKYREQNRERLKKYRREWAKRNPEKIRKYQADYWERKAAEALEGVNAE